MEKKNMKKRKKNGRKPPHSYPQLRGLRKRKRKCEDVSSSFFLRDEIVSILSGTGFLKQSQTLPRNSLHRIDLMQLRSVTSLFLNTGSKLDTLLEVFNVHVTDVIVKNLVSLISALDQQSVVVTVFRKRTFRIINCRTSCSIFQIGRLMCFQGRHVQGQSAVTRRWDFVLVKVPDASAPCSDCRRVLCHSYETDSRIYQSHIPDVRSTSKSDCPHSCADHVKEIFEMIESISQGWCSQRRIDEQIVDVLVSSGHGNPWDDQAPSDTKSTKRRRTHSRRSYSVIVKNKLLRTHQWSMDSSGRFHRRQSALQTRWST